MRCISVAYVGMRCLSVTFADHVKTNKPIFEIFSPSGSYTILVFLYQTGWRYSDGNPLTGASNAGAVGRNHDSEPISGFTACCERCDRPRVINTRTAAPPDSCTVPQVVTLTAGSKRLSLLIAGDDDEMFMTRSFDVKPKTTEQRLIVRSDLICRLCN